jgi:hypothetical protein
MNKTITMAKIIVINNCESCPYLCNTCIHDKFPKDKKIKDFSIIDPNCPLEDQISKIKYLPEFLYKYGGEIIFGYMGENIVTKAWKEWLEKHNLYA